ncbi:hypothetical protein CYLTODRAFT_416395 [Cylindrobasidium torrendii FP15055 ss-10]|uniref:Aminoglycoside phosphotransferase domain-containing protein n=1 Tax=Cylindrobasidium torrendii FP15055 ss-10 TaxID=1314674 RepID=A0A0D7BWV4_9AGAR|nr:hypothetical protein CYLTODRAFT_416395 [Cylindrobasidium torrendii FP15055 ss-10]
MKRARALDEALASEYARTHTKIPVPRVLDAVPNPGDSDGRSWIFLTDYVKGTPLWVPGIGHRLSNASQDELALVTTTITAWVAQLRNLRSPYGPRVCGFSGGPFISYRVFQSGKPIGPFENTAQLHAQTFCTVLPAELELASSELKAFIADRHLRGYEIKFTHGDIMLHNIIADENLKPVALVDWECAGWMPEYWEKASSLRGAFMHMWCWEGIAQNAFEPKYEDDMAVEELVQLEYDGVY